MIRLQQEVTELRSAVDVKLKEVEVKVRDAASVLTKSLVERTAGESLVLVVTMYKAAKHQW